MLFVHVQQSLLLLGLCLCCLPLPIHARSVTISNILPRRDVNGQIMDIHDGNTLYLDGTYYYYGASYGLCHEFDGDNGCANTTVGACGFQLNHNVSLFTSQDLVTWKPAEQPVFQFAAEFPIPVQRQQQEHHRHRQTKTTGTPYNSIVLAYTSLNILSLCFSVCVIVLAFI